MVITSSNPHSRELSIRKRIANIFSKREDDFPTSREYNDYVEEVEDMTSNLIEGIDVPVIEEKISQYQEENVEQITINRARKAKELAAALAASKGNHAQTYKDRVGQSSQAGVSMQGQYAPIVTVGQPQPQPVPLEVGPDTHGYELDDEETMRLREERSGRAGGWSVELSRKRAVDAAFDSVWTC